MNSFNHAPIYPSINYGTGLYASFFANADGITAATGAGQSPGKYVVTKEVTTIFDISQPAIGGISAALGGYKSVGTLKRGDKITVVKTGSGGNGIIAAPYLFISDNKFISGWDAILESAYTPEAECANKTGFKLPTKSPDGNINYPNSPEVTAAYNDCMNSKKPIGERLFGQGGALKDLPKLPGLIAQPIPLIAIAGWMGFSYFKKLPAWAWVIGGLVAMWGGIIIENRVNRNPYPKGAL